MEDTPPTKTETRREEYTVMPDYQVYEDLSDYEKELKDTAPVASPTTKKQVAKRPTTVAAAKNPPAAKTQTTTR